VTKAAGFYEVEVFVERWPGGPTDYKNAVVEFVRPWESSPLTPRYHEGWLNVYEWYPGRQRDGIVMAKPAKWVVWSVHRDRLGPMKLGTMVDPPE
jgi:hypothetical protein